MGKLFGTDGIRGEANKYPMNAQIAFLVGQAVTYLLRKENHRTRIIIGKDTRISGYMLESSLEAGITSMGGNPYLVGVLPTPGIAFITNSMRADAGIVISASHNPYEDNGIKIFGGNGFKLTDEQEETIEDLILNSKLAKHLPQSKDMGRAFRMEDVNGRYVVFLKNTFPRNLSMEGMKVVMDTANGATYRVAPDAFIELGADVEVLHNSPNGLNINDGCGSQHTADLRKRVLETGAAVGLAFDGDGDRLIAVDEKGREITGDQILLICAMMLKEEGRLKNDLLVSTVMSNLGQGWPAKSMVFVTMPQGGRPLCARGHAQDGRIIGGEDLRHLTFLNHHTTGDGIPFGHAAHSRHGQDWQAALRAGEVHGRLPAEAHKREREIQAGHLHRARAQRCDQPGRERARRRRARSGPLFRHPEHVPGHGRGTYGRDHRKVLHPAGRAG